jgi:sulfopyruvate decarboxylase subunit beta
MMKRDACLAILARHVTDEAVVATYQAAFDWMRIAPRDLNYVSIGAMGIASSHALGLALGRMVPRAGIEPATLRFSVACSTN